MDVKNKYKNLKNFVNRKGSTNTKADVFKLSSCKFFYLKKLQSRYEIYIIKYLNNTVCDNHCYKRFSLSCTVKKVCTIVHS